MNPIRVQTKPFAKVQAEDRDEVWSIRPQTKKDLDPVHPGDKQSPTNLLSTNQ